MESTCRKKCTLPAMHCDCHVSETCSPDELVGIHDHFMRMRSSGGTWSFSIADRLQMPLIRFIVRMAENNCDEFWLMACATMAGDLVGMRLPHDIIRRLYRIGVRHDDRSVRSAVAMRRELPHDLFRRMLSDLEDEVRRHFVFTHKNDGLSYLEIAYLDTIAADMTPGTSHTRYARYAIEEATRYLLDKNSAVRSAALKVIERAPVTSRRLCGKTLLQCLFDQCATIRARAHLLLRKTRRCQRA